MITICSIVYKTKKGEWPGGLGGEWPSGLRHCNQNQKILIRHSARLRDLTSLWGSQWPSGWTFTNAVINIELVRLSPWEWLKVGHGPAKLQLKKKKNHTEICKSKLINEWIKRVSKGRIKHKNEKIFASNKNFVEGKKIRLYSSMNPKIITWSKNRVDFYFHTSFWCLKKMKLLWRTTKKCENKNLHDFYFK